MTGDKSADMCSVKRHPISAHTFAFCSNNYRVSHFSLCCTKKVLRLFPKHRESTKPTSPLENVMRKNVCGKSIIMTIVTGTYNSADVVMRTSVEPLS